MVEGPLLPGLIRYSLPLIATGLLQLLYNAADMIVVARWAGGTALAAVGSNGALINLIVNVFIGLSVGATVVVSRAYGAGEHGDVHRAVHCAMAVSVISGLITMAAGLLISRQALVWMGTPDDVIEQAALYLRIYFLGMPALMIFNFGAAILRAVGDTRRPLYILSTAGLINVGLNLLLVIPVKWDVAGVAVATTVSQIFSAVMVVLCLTRAEGSYRYVLRQTRFDKEKFWQMLRHGVPAGLQSSIFSLSNILIQSSVNSFGSAAMSGNTAAANLEGLAYVAMNSMHQTCLTFTAQNVGARRIDRVRRSIWLCLALVTVIGLVMGTLLYLLGPQMLTLFTAAQGTDTTIAAEDILAFGMTRMSIIVTTYFICGLMDTLVGAMRGMGSPWMPMLVSVAGVCGIRVVWIFTVFRFWDHTLTSLYLSYPVSWAVTAAVHAVCVIVTFHRLRRIMSRSLPGGE